MSSNSKDKDTVSEVSVPSGDRTSSRLHANPSSNNNNNSNTSTTMKMSSDLQSTSEPKAATTSTVKLPQRATNMHSKVQSSQLVAAISEPATVEASAFRILPMINSALDSNSNNSSMMALHSGTNNTHTNSNINSTNSSTLGAGITPQSDDSNNLSFPSSNVTTPSNEISNPLSRHPLRSKKSTVSKPIISNDSINIQQDQIIQEQHHQQLQQQQQQQQHKEGHQEIIDKLQKDPRKDLQLYDPQDTSLKDSHHLPETTKSHDSIGDSSNPLRFKKTAPSLLSTHSVSNMRSVSNPNSSISSVNPNGAHMSQSNSNLSVNTNTVTSLSSVASSRAEHFAAKIHSAIKEDEKTSDSDESFVYETTANSKNTQQLPNSSNNSTVNSTNNISAKVNCVTPPHHSVHVLSPLAQPIVPENPQLDTQTQTSSASIVHPTDNSTTIITTTATTAKNIPVDLDSSSDIATQSSPASQTKYPMGSTNSNTSTVINQMNGSTSTTAPNNGELKTDNRSELASQSDTYVNNYGPSNSQVDLNQSAYSNNSKPGLKSKQPVVGLNGVIQNSESSVTNNNNNDDNSNYDGRSSRRLSRTAIDPLQQLSPQMHNSTQSTTNTNSTSNKLRQITNKVFDSKGTLPRRYSGLDVNDFSVDDIDDDFDEEELIGLNQYHYPHNMHGNVNNNNSTIPSEIDFRHNFDYGLNEPLLKGKPGYNALNHHYGSVNEAVPLHGGNQSPNQAYFNSYNSNNGSINNDHFNSYGTTLYNNGTNLMSSNSNGGGNINGNGNPPRVLRSNKHRQDLYFSPHNFTSARAARLKQVKNFCYTVSLIFLLVSMGFISGFILATTKELQRTRVVDINEILISQEEFVFNMAVQSFNPGFLSIVIQDVELDIFAKSKHITDEISFRTNQHIEANEESTDLVTVNKVKNYADSDTDVDKKYSTVLLGRITHLDIPLVFQGGFFTRDEGLSITEIKIVNPCSDKPSSNETTMANSLGDVIQISESSSSDSEIPYFEDDYSDLVDITSNLDDLGKRQWLNISKNKFDLIIRGSLTYELPIANSNRTVGVNKVFHIDPNNLPQHGEGLSGFYDHGHDHEGEGDDGDDEDDEHKGSGLGKFYLGEHRFLHDINHVFQ